ncbi:hypothetical protein FHS26_003074 [Rhizobium pisi]|uniref:Uncharacterized protein n=1 Tax=Rhizobium pisi TaxID=574561 RepID=A0A427N3P6_9HYPH|nr:hypothetical protein [Rhizobium pisi]RSB81469.1 hypothetical protein EFD55_09535 [Rhizobium pisi]
MQGVKQNRFSTLAFNTHIAAAAGFSDVLPLIRGCLLCRFTMDLFAVGEVNSHLLAFWPSRADAILKSHHAFFLLVLAWRVGDCNHFP